MKNGNRANARAWQIKNIFRLIYSAPEDEKHSTNCTEMWSTNGTRLAVCMLCLRFRRMGTVMAVVIMWRDKNSERCVCKCVTQAEFEICRIASEQPALCS